MPRSGGSDEEKWTVFIGHSYQNEANAFKGLSFGFYNFAPPLKLKSRNRIIAIFSCSSSSFSTSLISGAGVMFTYKDKSGEGLAKDQQLMNAAYAFLMYLIQAKEIDMEKALKEANKGRNSIPYEPDEEDIIIMEGGNK